jgi:hypothetical protein
MNYKKLTIIALSLITTVSMAGVAVSAQNSDNTIKTKIESALVSKNLADWKSSTKEASNTRIDATTQEELDTMSDKYTKHQAVENAIKNNDYEAFKQSADSNMLARVNSQETFNTLVTEHKTREEFHNKITETIKNNDFNTYQELMKNKPTSTLKKDDDSRTRPEPTEEELKTRFEKQVADYKADGSLPGDDKFMTRGGFDRELGNRGGHKMR